MPFADDVGMLWSAPPKKERLGPSFVPRPLPEATWQAPTELPTLRNRGLKRISFDVETHDEDLLALGPGTRRGAYVVGLSVGTDDGHRWYFPVRHEGGGNMDETLVKAWARDELNAFDGEVVGAHLLYDLEFMAMPEWGVTFKHAKGFHDVLLAEPLIDEWRPGFSLDNVAHYHLNEGKKQGLLYDWAAATGGWTTDKQVKQNLWRAHAAYVGEYGEGDADLPLRILDKQLEIIAREDLQDVYDVERGLLPLLLAMRLRGVRVNVPRAEEVHERLKTERDKWVSEVKRLAGPQAELMAPASFAAALQDRGLPVPMLKSGKLSVTKGWLKQFAGKDILVDSILGGRRVDKIVNTYTGNILRYNVNGRIYPEFPQLKGEEGGTIARFCVDGDTRLETNRGVFRIKDYRPTGHDLIRTHTGRWRRILRKFYKGEETMYTISLRNGSQITATAGHRILTPFGWRCTSDLQIGDQVYYGDPTGGATGLQQNQANCRFIPRVGQTDDRRRSNPIRRAISNSRLYSANASNTGAIQARETDSVLAEQVWITKSNAGQDRIIAPSLQGCGVRSRWLCYEKNRRSTRSTAYQADEGVARIRSHSERHDCTPYRRRQDEFSRRQSSLNDQSSSRAHACPYEGEPISQIDNVGTRAVWDIEVEHDHSYIAEGFVNHNSSAHPNAQNQPARDEELGPLTRSIYEPESGEKWEKQDASQIEFRLLVHFAALARDPENNQPLPGAEEARRAYVEDPTTDFHALAACMINIDPEDLIARKRVKSVNFCAVFMGGDDKLAETIGCSLQEASEFSRKYHARLPFVRRTGILAMRRAQKTGYITTLLKRRQRFTMWEPRYNSGSKSNRKAKMMPREEALLAYGPNIQRAFCHAGLNRALQGSAADILKKGYVDMWKAGVCDVLGAPHLTVHDETGWSNSNTKIALEAAAEARRCMEQAIPLCVPLRVDWDQGNNWGECK